MKEKKRSANERGKEKKKTNPVTAADRFVFVGRRARWARIRKKKGDSPLSHLPARGGGSRVPVKREKEKKREKKKRRKEAVHPRTRQTSEERRGRGRARKRGAKWRGRRRVRRRGMGEDTAGEGEKRLRVSTRH
jgi:hypothetical protein